jgi:hypothetical protein
MRTMRYQSHSYSKYWKIAKVPSNILVRQLRTLLERVGYDIGRGEYREELRELVQAMVGAVKTTFTEIVLTRVFTGLPLPWL